MGYRKQFQQDEFEPFEITWVVRHNQHLLRPDDQCIESLLGVIGRTQHLYGDDLHLYYPALESTHIHIVGAVRNVQVGVAVKRHLATNMSKEICALRGLDRGGIWGRRNKTIPILSDLNERLKYLLAHGYKSGLVPNISAWPGLKTLDVVLKGKALTGTWYNRTKYSEDLWAWKQRKKSIKKSKDGEAAKRDRLEELFASKPQLADYGTVYPVTLTTPPTMAGMSEAEQRAAWQTLVDEAEEKYAPERRKSGAKRPVLGLAKVLATNPLKKPRKPKRRTPAPWVHGTDVQAKAWKKRYYASASHCRSCMDRLAAGARAVRFLWETWTPVAFVHLRAEGPEVQVAVTSAA
jgi:hypothetical protein